MTGCRRREVWVVHRYVGTDGERCLRDLAVDRKTVQTNVGKKWAKVRWRRDGTWVSSAVSAKEREGRGITRG